MGMLVEFSIAKWVKKLYHKVSQRSTEVHKVFFPFYGLFVV